MQQHTHTRLHFTPYIEQLHDTKTLPEWALLESVISKCQQYYNSRSHTHTEPSWTHGTVYAE